MFIILALVIIQTVGKEQGIEPKVDAWVIDADKRTQVGTISWYKNTYKQVADRAYISIETDESPVRAIWSNKFDIGAGWNFPIYFREKSGLRFTIEEVSIAYFSSETAASVRIFDEEILESWWADLIIPANEEKRTNIGFGLQELVGLGVMVKGMDEHGNQLEFHDYIELSQEVVE